MIKLTLTKKEKEVICRVIKVQLDSLYKILNHASPIDVTLHCIENEINPQELEQAILDELDKFEQLLCEPENVLSLDEDNLSIVRHILFNFIKKKKFAKAKARVWKKLFTHEKIIQFYNPN